MPEVSGRTKQAPLPILIGVLLFGICCSAISFIFIRESTERSIMLAAWRVLLASILLFPMYWHARKHYGDAPIIGIIKRSAIPGIVLSLHFIAWVAGARLTPGANATLVVNLMPLVMPFLMYFMYKETLQRREWIATVLAVFGIAVLSINDIQISRDHFNGDVLCFVSMLLFAVYLALARRNLEALPSIWLYVVPMYAVAGLVSLFIAALTGPISPNLNAYNVLMVVLLAAVSTVIGHTALNYAMQYLRGQTVTLLNMLQFVVAGIAGYLLYQEVPTTLFYFASSLIVLAMLLVILKPGSNSNT